MLLKSFKQACSLLVAFSLGTTSAIAQFNPGNESFLLDANRLLNGAGLGRNTSEVKSSTAKASSFSARVKASNAAQESAEVSGLIIRFKSDDAKQLSRENKPPAQALIDEVLRLAGNDLTYGRAMSLDSFVFKFARSKLWSEAQAVLERVKASPNVEAVDVDTKSSNSFVPNDQYISLEWSVQSPSSYAGSANLFRAWDITRGSSNTIVAVVDTGIRPHPEFASRLLPGYDFVSDRLSANDGDGRDADASDPGDWRVTGECGAGFSARSSTWHGTHVTGTIAASGNNFAGIAGMNWNTRILPVRVLGKCGGDVSDIVDGMVWAAGLSVPGVPNNPYPAKVINLSLGGYKPGGCASDSPYQTAINSIKSTGALIVVAAGNNEMEAASFVPASCQGVLTIAAVGPYGDIASYSNYSVVGTVKIAAPGGDMKLGNWAGILSTVDTGTSSPAGPWYGYKDGTSMAAPHVSGIASLALTVDPTISPEFLYASLMLASRSFPYWSVCNTYNPVCGLGIVDAEGTLNAVNALKPYLLVYEFKNTALDHYFRTSTQAEYANVLRGSAGPGWVDTQDYFLAWKDASLGASPVCRFYSTQFNSHFYTASASECATVKTNPVWSYEGIAYYAKLPGAGGCPSGTKKIYRAYNNRADGNHRFTTDYSLIQALVAQKWAYEGVVMCAAGG